jgi:ectoine hydroxylase-related dioxygenase (phytanoyl-CoA dioxygenase family)
MVSLRLNLDPTGESDGPLRVISGSHLFGRLDLDAIERLKKSGREAACHLESGEILAMRPLLLHASSPASKPRHRRVVHIEFSPDKLPGKLAWYEDAVHFSANSH